MRHLLALCLIVFGIHLPAHAVEKRLSILYAADMPVISKETKGGYPRLATAVSQHRAQSGANFFLFGGNSLGPSSLSLFDSGSHIIDLLNSIEPDAMGVTKREYSYFEEELSLRAYEAAFPLVASNIIDPRDGEIQDGLTQGVIIESHDAKLGVIAIIGPNAAHEYLLQHIQILEEESSIRRTASLLRIQGAEVIVVLHDSQIPSLTALIAQGIVDLSITKNQFFQPASPESNSQRILTLVKPDRFLKIDISWDSEIANSSRVDWRVEELAKFVAEPEMTKQRNDYINRLDRLLDLPVARITTPFDTLRKTVRTGESSFANYIADTMLNYTKAQIAIFNSGIIRGNQEYSAGHIFTRKDLVKELPFRTGLVVVKIQGQQILDSFNNSFSQLKESKGKFLQVGNLEVVYDSSLPRHSRLKSVKYMNQPIDPERVYSVATTDYLFNGGDNYTQFASGTLEPSDNGTTTMIADIVLQRMLKEQTVTVSKSNRLVDLNESR